MAGVGGGSYHDVSRDGGVRDLIAELTRASGETGEERQGPAPIFWLTLAALLLLLVEGAADAPHRWSRAARGNEAP